MSAQTTTEVASERNQKQQEIRLSSLKTHFILPHSKVILNILISYLVLAATMFWIIGIISIISTFTKPSSYDVDDRPYNTKKYFWGNDFKNDVGNWYGYIVMSHALAGTLANFTHVIPLWLTLKGSKSHVIFGMITIIFWSCLIFFGMFGTFSWGLRGYHPCRYIKDVDNPKSFSVFIYIHFTYWVFLMMESIIYSLGSAIVKTEFSEYNAFHKYCLTYLSYSSIVSNFFRFSIYVAMLIKWKTFANIPCSDTITPLIEFVVAIIELPMCYSSYLNLAYIKRTKRCANLLDEAYLWRSQHSRNILTGLSLLVWTLLANVIYKLDSNYGGIYMTFIYLSLPISSYTYVLYYKKKSVRKLRSLLLYKNAHIVNTVYGLKHQWSVADSPKAEAQLTQQLQFQEQNNNVL